MPNPASRIPLLESRTPNLLVVEDDDDDYFLVQDLLRNEMAAQGQQAKSVDEALNRLDQSAFDAILLDYGLGAKNGLDMLSELRARQSTTPVIFLTGHGGEEVAVRALKGGAIDYLPKAKMTAQGLGAAVRHALAISAKDAAVRAAQDALAAREREYRTLFEQANDAILIVEADTEIVLEANPAALRLYGCEHDQLIGKALIEFSTDIVRGREAIEQCLRTGELSNFETVHVSREGRRFSVLVNAAIIEYRGTTALLCVLRDITERKAAEQEIQRLNRALMALSKCNEALLAAHEQQKFLDDICHIVVQVGRYPMAWVAAAPAGPDDEIRPFAWAGATGDYLKIVCKRYRDAEIRASLLVPAAIATGAPAVCRDTSASPFPMRKECAEHGFGSILALPLHINATIFGALAIYAGEPDAFDNAEVELLTELGANVSYGLESIEARQQREIAQQELRASEERLRNLIRTASEGICIIDTESRVTFVNAALAAMLGGTPEDMVGRSVYDFVVEERKEFARARIAEARDAATARLHLEGTLLHTTGTKVFVSINTSAIIDGEGRFAGMLAMVTDITEKKQAEEKLRASELHLRNLFETANEGIWTIDADDRTTLVNAKMAEMLGRTTEEMLGSWVGDFSDPSQYDILRESMEKMRANTRMHYEISLVRKDGTRIITSLNSSPIFDAESRYAGALAMVSDITEQKQAEERLRESERRYRTLFERNLAGVFRATAEGMVVEGNEAFRRMLGYETQEELQTLNLPQMCAAAGCAEHWCEALARSGQLVNQEICVLRKDGSTAYLLANLVALRDGEGKAEFIEGTVLDITERRQLQAQLLHAQKMDAIGQLAGGIAHDFNNLLMVMRSYAEMAGESVEDAAVRRQLEAIVKAADRGAALTRQLLTFGRKQMFSPRVMDLNNILENMTKVLPRALGEDVRVELRPATGLWQVKADPVQIEQLVLNLAVNARDAMPEGGRLTLETSNVQLDSSYIKLHADVLPGDYVLLAVSDTGHGIPPDILPRIFEPFFTTKERGKGTGLGLPTVYGIVRQCGGFVWVYSEPQQGSVFKIYLPRAVSGTSAPAVGPNTSEEARTGSETILLVEDEEAVRCAARDYLSRRGYRVFEAASGEEALRVAQLQKDAIDMLITDAIMPGISGLVLAQKMAERRPGIRILCVSGYTEASMATHAANITAAFLQKPFSLAVLANKVRELLDAAPVPPQSREQSVA